MSTSAAPLNEITGPKEESLARESSRGHLDVQMLIGIAIALIAVVAGIGQTGVSVGYFFQPTGVLIVVVGTLGVTIVTTPRQALEQAASRVLGLLSPQDPLRREDLIEEIVSYARESRTHGMEVIEGIVANASNGFLREALLMSLDVKDRGELQSALENKLRLEERQNDADARVLETAAGYAPAIGVLGTVVGLIDALRRFSTTSSVASGMGIAFVSTVYGLALANLLLLPAASRIRARAAESFETKELMTEGVLCLFDSIHPRLIRQRLACFCRGVEQ